MGAKSVDKFVDTSPAKNQPLSPKVYSRKTHISAAQPSFNCQKATTRDEHILCSDPEAARLDKAMSQLYKDLRKEYKAAGMGSKDLIQSQRNWLKTRGICESPECIRRLVKERIELFEREKQDIKFRR